MVGTAIMGGFALGIALSPSPVVADGCALLAGLGAAASFPLILSFAGKFPRWHAGVVFSAVILAGALGRIVFPYLVGPLAHAAGFRVAMGMAFVLAAAVAVLAFYLHRVAGEDGQPDAGTGEPGFAAEGRQELAGESET
ncbi:MAG: hypothetical protein H5T84_02375 [Thermoleophilia bacterium]|nr:hypothetical protein [Thermoleophilia bacterium]